MFQKKFPLIVAILAISTASAAAGDTTTKSSSPSVLPPQAQNAPAFQVPFEIRRFKPLAQIAPRVPVHENIYYSALGDTPRVRAVRYQFYWPLVDYGNTILGAVLLVVIFATFKRSTSWNT